MFCVFSVVGVVEDQWQATNHLGSSSSRENKSYASPESDEKYGFGTHLIIQIRVWQKRGQISGPFYREVLFLDIFSNFKWA